MKTRNSRFFITLLIACFVATNAVSTSAAEPPVAVVSINNTETLISDVEYLMEATGTAGLRQFIMPQIKNYLQGINSKKPIGVVITMDGMEPKPLAFVPVDDLETVLSTVKDQVGEAKEAGDDVYELQGPQPMFVKDNGGWAFVAMDPAELEDVPADPTSLLNGMNETYDIAVRGFIQNIPKQLRDMAIQNIGEQMKKGAANADESQLAMIQTQIEQIKRIFDEGEAITLGWSIDSKNKSTFFDFAMTGKAGTDLAKQLDTANNTTTKYSGFIAPNAAVSSNLSSVLDKKSIDQTVAMLDNFEETATKEIEEDDDIEEDAIRVGAKKLVAGVFDIFRDTVKTGKMDSAMSVILEDKALTMAIAGHVADGSQVEGLVKDLIDLAKSDDEVKFSKMNLNSGKHGNVRIHELAISIPDDEYIGKVLGRELEVCIGADDHDVYVALGDDPVNNLKKMIDNSKSPAKSQPASLVVKLAPILRFASSVEGDKTLTAMADMLEKSGNDHVRMTASGIANGVSYRFQIEEGILKMLGQLGAMRGAGF